MHLLAGGYEGLPDPTAGVASSMKASDEDTTAGTRRADRTGKTGLGSRPSSTRLAPLEDAVI